MKNRTSLLLAPWLQVHQQLLLFPKHEHHLIDPVLAFFSQLQVVLSEDIAGDPAHLEQGHPIEQC